MAAPEEVPPWLCFLAFTFLPQVLMSMDGGSMSATVDCMRDLGFSQVELSAMGCVAPAGMTVSSVLWGRALQLVPAKLLVTAGLGVAGISALVFGSVWSLPSV